MIKYLAFKFKVFLWNTYLYWNSWTYIPDNICQMICVCLYESWNEMKEINIP